MSTEADTCRKFVVPRLQKAGRDDAPYAINEQRSFTDGRVIFVGGKPKRGSRSAPTTSCAIAPIIRLPWSRPRLPTSRRQTLSNRPRNTQKSSGSNSPMRPMAKSRSTHEVSRPLLTPDEAMRMKGARKNAQGMITEPGNMVIYVAGYPAIMGLQPLYFRDSELARRARIPAESAQTKKLGDTLATASG